ncbi:hypothetical protein KKF91_03160 [Myxococcota bacterium]|nr:hypothetical protein [Myxococcota bacterium]MBU1429540.1 hypothetical protein [Myxococcota bacterium]MBU1898913.1 hypothetical protein [Myxococcota bacterium]
MRYLILLTLISWGCEGTSSQPVTFNQDGGGAAGAGGDAGDAGASGPVENPAWIAIQDTTGGLGIGAFTGCEIDAITWVCPSGAGAASAAEGSQRNGADAFPVDPGLGEPDGPCLDSLESCTAPLGLEGWLAFKTNVESLSGCEVTVHEHPDEDQNSFNIYKCTGPDLNADCRIAGQGVDGENVFSF